VRRGSSLLLFVLVGCSLSVTESDYVGGARADAGPAAADAGSDGDGGGTDAGDQCSDDAPFGALQPVAGLEDVVTLSTPHLSVDELEVYVDNNDGTLLRATRDSKTGRFSKRTVLSSTKPPASSSSERNPMLSVNRLDLFFTSTLNDGNGFHLHRSRRAKLSDDFPAGTALLLEGANETFEPFLSFDGTELFYAVTIQAGGNSHIHRVTMSDQTPTSSTGDVLDTLVASSESSEAHPVLSPDGRTIYFSRLFEQAQRLWRATRADTKTTTFSAPTLATDITAAPLRPGWISPDNCRFYVLLDQTPRFAQRSR
jgi:hypothetical protein